MDKSIKVMRAALDHADERTKEIQRKWKAEHGREFGGTAAGWTESCIGTVKCCFVEAQSRVKLQNHATRTIWYLNDRRIARAKLVELLNA